MRVLALTASIHVVVIIIIIVSTIIIIIVIVFNMSALSLEYAAALPLFIIDNLFVNYRLHYMAKIIVTVVLSSVLYGTNY